MGDIPNGVLASVSLKMVRVWPLLVRVATEQAASDGSSQPEERLVQVGRRPRAQL